MGMPPEIAGRRLHLDDVGAEIGQDYGSAGTGDEAREVNDLQSGKDIVARHGYSFILAAEGACEGVSISIAKAMFTSLIWSPGGSAKTYRRCHTNAPRPVMALPTIRFCI
jgi:hypothetical protein